MEVEPEEALTLEGSLGGSMVQSGGEASASLGFKRVGGGSGTVRIGCKVRSDLKSWGFGGRALVQTSENSSFFFFFKK